MIVIIGAGLAGLSTASFLGRVPHKVFEREATVGGLCRSHQVDGFTFDQTGHVLHCKSAEIRRFVEKLLGNTLVSHSRHSAIYSKNVLTPYPFQVHLHGLPQEVIRDCLLGYVSTLVNRESSTHTRSPSFKAWILDNFGEGIAKHFMVPFNEKLWNVPLEELTTEWTGLVPRPALQDVINGALGIGDREFGYNTRFFYPRSGGIQALPSALLQRIRSVECQKEVIEINTKSRRVHFADGSMEHYEALVSTMPLPELLRRCTDLPKTLRERGEKLRWTSVYAVNLAVMRKNISSQHWIYFPEKTFPFYRIGFPMNLSPAMGKVGASSIAAEIARRPGEDIPRSRLIKQTRAGLIRAGVCRPDDTFVVSEVRDIPYAYVIFDRERGKIVPKMLGELERRGIYSIGRYGRWEHTSMENAIQQGKDTATRLRRF
ncbi:MAG TPA: protoporphyrinogen oxidase [Nitrospirales bacterium]|nr:protoporphyrinogen oxidase [Nitrospirales bacterium]HIA14123.1 protoporphyrinogen oxidase [Nitrospirales bacterium]HIB53458.1 protoporphyrinogen oxidase [Nitrospirales bacterium]HIC04705.1 protoporphyrinogen oxidase [Nitrospirales bacterium]HIN34006.1 protoporphyrinogen oxidase [Nitrospirales bacterium]